MVLISVQPQTAKPEVKTPLENYQGIGFLSLYAHELQSKILDCFRNVDATYCKLETDPDYNRRRQQFFININISGYSIPLLLEPKDITSYAALKRSFNIQMAFIELGTSHCQYRVEDINLSQNTIRIGNKTMDLSHCWHENRIDLQAIHRHMGWDDVEGFFHPKIQLLT